MLDVIFSSQPLMEVVYFIGETKAYKRLSDLPKVI